MKIASIMSRDPVTASSDTGLDEGLRLMDQYHVRHLPVVDRDRLVGMVSDRDLLVATGWLPVRVHDIREGPLSKRRQRVLADVMGTPVHTVGPDDDLLDAGAEILGQGFGALPVVESDGRLIGIVSEVDLVGAYVRACGGGEATADLDPEVSAVMTRDALVLPPDATLEDARRLCHESESRHLPVLDQSRVIGMISDRDLRRATGSGRPDHFPIDELMSTDVQACPPGTRLSEAARKMHVNGISALLVIEDDEFLGLLTFTDVVNHCLDGLRQHPTAFASA